MLLNTFMASISPQVSEFVRAKTPNVVNEAADAAANLYFSIHRRGQDHTRSRSDARRMFTRGHSSRTGDLKPSSKIVE